MERYLIDTNAISGYLSASFQPKGMALMITALDAIPNISVITQIELLCWKTDPITTQYLESFINDSTVLNISPDIITHCVKLRKGKKIKTPDAIIAATALAYNYTLITVNDNDFKGINKLKVVNPLSL